MTGERKCNVRTPHLVDDPQGYRRAVDLANEKSRATIVMKSGGGGEMWGLWVQGFLETHYRGSPKSLGRALLAWKQWQAFLKLRGIPVPRALTYGSVMDFFSWRTGQVRRTIKKNISHNTALYDIRFMSVVMREAVRRGFALNNPCSELGMKKDKPAEKPEITDEEVEKIRAALLNKPEWMTTAFEIAMHQGCRLRETRINKRDVDFARGVVTLRAKGGKVFATKLHPKLVPMLRSLFAKSEWTLEFPQMPSKDWWTLFKELELDHLCFHCTRVTVITKLARAGVPVQQTMAYVGHANETIHKIYQRLNPADLNAVTAAIK
jgi:hypothetical protein